MIVILRMNFSFSFFLFIGIWQLFMFEPYLSFYYQNWAEILILDFGASWIWNFYLLKFMTFRMYHVISHSLFVKGAAARPATVCPNAVRASPPAESATLTCAGPAEPASTQSSILKSKNSLKMATHPPFMHYLVQTITQAARKTATIKTKTLKCVETIELRWKNGGKS